MSRALNEKPQSDSDRNGLARRLVQLVLPLAAISTMAWIALLAYSLGCLITYFLS